jgi:hypothetical protein
MKAKDKAKIITGLKDATAALESIETEPEKNCNETTVGEPKHGELALVNGGTMAVLALASSSFTPVGAYANVINIANGVGNFPKTMKCVRTNRDAAFAVAGKY